MLSSLIFIYGCCVGSFLNVIFIRLPFEKSFVFPGSQCKSCGASINWFDNIPIISWLLLNGKCRFCSNNISIQYPLVEFFTGILWLLTYDLKPLSLYDFPLYINIISNLVLITILFAITYFDLKYFWIPLKIVIFGSIYIIFIFLFQSIIEVSLSKLFVLLENIFVGSVTFYLFEFIRKKGRYLFNKDVLGKGDSFLIAMGALWIGFYGTLISLFIAFNSATIIELTKSLFLYKKIDRKGYFAFGPYICLGILIVWIFGYQFLWNGWVNVLHNFVF